MWILKSLRVTLCNAFSYINLASLGLPFWPRGRSLIRPLPARAACLPQDIPPDDPRDCDDLFTTRVGGALTQVSLGRPPDHPCPCGASVTVLIGERRGHAHPLPQGPSAVHPLGCNDWCSSRVQGASNMSRGGLRCILGIIRSAARLFTSRRRVPFGDYSPAASGPPPDQPPGCSRCDHVVRLAASKSLSPAASQAPSGLSARTLRLVHPSGRVPPRVVIPAASRAPWGSSAWTRRLVDLPGPVPSRLWS
jgi:hypothetical protein